MLLRWIILLCIINHRNKELPLRRPTNIQRSFGVTRHFHPWTFELNTFDKHFHLSFWPVWRETMLLVQEDQSCSAQGSTVVLLGKPPSPARNSQGCWKPESFTFTQYFISDIPFFSPLWCWQWQDEKAFWESLPPAARHSCQPWTIFSKISAQSRKYLVLSTNSVTVIK